MVTLIIKEKQYLVESASAKPGVYVHYILKGGLGATYHLYERKNGSLLLEHRGRTLWQGRWSGVRKIA